MIHDIKITPLKNKTRFLDENKIVALEEIIKMPFNFR